MAGARTFEEYAGRYDHVAMTRSADGVIELALHTDGGPLVWGDGPHTELGYCFADVAADPENRVVILTGSGGEFIGRLDESWVGPMTPAKWDKIFSHAAGCSTPCSTSRCRWWRRSTVGPPSTPSWPSSRTS